MASILQRGECSFQVTVRRRGFPTETKTFRSKTDAKRWARMIESNMDLGKWQNTSLAEKLSLGEVLGRYKAEVSVHKKGGEIESGKINALSRDQICAIKMSELSNSDIAQWRDRRLKSVKGATVNREFAIISHAIEIARKEWKINIENPCKIVRKATGSKSRNRRLENQEETYLIQALNFTKNPYVKPMTELGIETTMRRGELLALTWNNVDLVKRVASLPDTKNGEMRDVPLSSKSIEILKALPRSESANVFPLSMEAFKQSYVRSVERARKLYINECAKNGLPPDPSFMNGLRFHDLRHEGTSRLFELGLNIMEVASITGHKSLQMLQRYTHLKAENLAKKLQ